MAVTETLGLEIVTEGLQKFLGDMKSADGAVDKTASGWSKAGGVIQGVAGAAFKAVAIGAAAAAAAVGVVGGAIVKLTLDAVPLKGVADAFEGIADTTTLGSEKMMAALQAGSYGMVSQTELMKSFNSAAQLVSVDFAEKLPDAMQYLGKISAATGEDMGFMVDSLVKGVGRLSPAILDNLKIQVSLEEATAAASKMFGVEAGELTKAQQQAGMMNVVLEKLATNTAAMPEVTGSAAQQMAALKAQVQDAKDMIGMAFIPVLQQVLTPLLALAERVLPLLVQGFENFAEKIGFFTSYLKFAREEGDYLNDWLQELPAFIQPVAALIGGLAVAFDTFKYAISVGIAPLDALKLALQTTFGEETSAAVMSFIDGVRNGIETLRPFVEQIGATFQTVWGYIQEAVASVVPVVIEYIQMMIPIWQEWGAFIGQVVQQVVDFALPLIESMAAFFTEKIGFIVAWVQANLPLFQATFETTLTAIQNIWNVVWPAIQLVVTSVWTVIQTVITVALTAITAVITAVMQAIQGDWESAWETIKQAAASIWETIKAGFVEFLNGVLTALGTSMAEFIGVWQSNWDTAVTIVNTIWENIKTAVSEAWNGIVDFVKTGIENVKEAISSQISSFMTLGGDIIRGIISGITAAAGALGDAVRTAAQNALNAAKAALGIHSPSSVFRAQVGRNISAGIIAGIGDLAPQISAQVQAVTSPGGRGTSTHSTTINNNYNLTTNSLTRPGGLALEFQTMGMASR